MFAQQCSSNILPALSREGHYAASKLPEPLVQFNIFGGPKQGYFSPEPWFGLQNSLNLEKGLVRLVPGKQWDWRVESKLGSASGQTAGFTAPTRFSTESSL